MRIHFRVSCVMLLLLSCVGCQSPYHSDQGALLGGLGGAGIGALIGAKSGHAGAGGADRRGRRRIDRPVVGNEMDKSDARNRGDRTADGTENGRRRRSPLAT